MRSSQSIRALVAICLAALFTAQCSLSPSPTPQTSPVPVYLAGAPQAREIHIQRIEEYGISTRPWISANYDLQRDSGQFTGRAEFRIRAATEPYRREAIVDVVIPHDIAEEFLRKLAQIPLQEGDYRPPVFCTDCFRFSMRIELVLETESVTLFMESSDRTDTQWGATIGGQTYLITTNAPMEAVELLTPYLREDEIERLTQEGESP